MRRIRIILHALFFVLFVCIMLNGCSGSQYKEAKKLMDNGSYAEAAAIFTTIQDYQDSLELYKACIYSQAKSLFDSGEYMDAADLFYTIKEYEDASDQYSSCIYNQGQTYMQNNNYTEAKTCFEQIREYRDSTDLISKCDHIIAVKNDTTAPVIKGISEGEIIEVEFNSDYNLKNYVQSVIKITDDVSGDINDYKVKTEATAYDPDNGKIDTLKDGTYNFNISAVDEAGNKANVGFSVHVDALLRITKDSIFPVTLYDGELGTYTLNPIIHYSSWKTAPEYYSGYYFEIEIENRSYAEEVAAYIGHGYLNDYRVPVKSDQNLMIARGKKGSMYSFIDDDDLDEKTRDFDRIECQFFIEDNEDENMFSRPILIDRDVVEYD